MTEEGALIAGRYRLIAQVGTGAMGVVWQAHDERLRRTVAVKQLLMHAGMDQAQSEEATRRVMREGRIAARLQHPSAIAVYDVAQHEGQPCLIMEYAPAQSLSAVLTTRGVLPPEDVAKIGSQIAGALAAAHEAGIVHRDIKPGNVLLTDDGTAKITDFGVSRAVGDSTVTATGMVAGTPAYLAPEVAQGQDATFSADVFSLGSTLYAAVDAAPPFGLDDNPMALLYRIATSEITPPSQAGPLTPLLMQMLHRDLEHRPTMRQVHEALTAVTATSASAALAAPVAEPDAPALSILEPPAAADSAASAAGTAASPSKSAFGVLTRLTPSRRAVLAITGVVGSLVIAGLILVATVANDEAPIAAPVPIPASSPATAPQDTTPVRSPSPAPSSPPATSSPPAPAPAAAPPPAPAPTPAPNTPGPQPTAAQLRAAVTDYYALMPANLDAAWPRMTSDYQRNHAGGIDGYRSFWAPIERVTASDVSAAPPDTVTATLTYFYDDGRIVEERTVFGLVAEDGIWKIASSTVLNSRARQA